MRDQNDIGEEKRKHNDARQGKARDKDALEGTTTQEDAQGCYIRPPTTIVSSSMMVEINQFRQFNSLDPKELACSINQFRQFHSLDPKELAFNDAISGVCSP